jgi:hypothetical protein
MSIPLLGAAGTPATFICPSTPTLEFCAGPNNDFYQLSGAEGELILENRQTTATTPMTGPRPVGSTGYVKKRQERPSTQTSL